MKAVRITGKKIIDNETVEEGKFDLNLDQITYVSISESQSETTEESEIIGGSISFANDSNARIIVDAENLAIVEAAMEIDAQS